MTPTFSDEIFNDPTAARKALEAIRWPNGPTCIKCGAVEGVVRVEGEKKSHRDGLLYCNTCKGQFTVTVGTVFEKSKIPLNKWWLATFLLCSSKKGMSSHQLHRTLGVSYKTAWFMTHRIREAMRSGSLVPMGGNGGAVEADETFIGREPGKQKKPSFHHKMKVLSLVDRTTKQVRSQVVDDLRPSTLLPILRENIAKESRLMTDEAGYYHRAKADFTTHETVKHKDDEYVRGDVTTNTVESYFSTFKRGMVGTYQHCAKEHLHRYLAEFDFRYNHRSALEINDAQRTRAAMAGIVGKRLTYK
jgi:transposase-like protein